MAREILKWPARQGGWKQVKTCFGHCAFMASRFDLIADPQGWFLRFCVSACAAHRINNLNFVHLLSLLQQSEAFLEVILLLLSASRTTNC